MAAGLDALPTAHQTGDALEQGNQGVVEDGDHDQRGNDQAGQDSAELRRPLTLLVLAEERDGFSNLGYDSSFQK